MGHTIDIDDIFVLWLIQASCISLRWRHNDQDGVSNHQPHGCLLNRLFRRRSNKTSKLRVTGLCVGNSPGPVNSPHKGPVTRKMFPFDDVIMYASANSVIIGSGTGFSSIQSQAITQMKTDQYLTNRQSDHYVKSSVNIV